MNNLSDAIRLNKKGQSILLTHAILVGFTIFLIYVVSTTFVSIRSDYQKFIGTNEVTELCLVMRGAVDKIYTKSDYNFTTTTIVGYIDVSMPEKITDMRYIATFANRSVSIASLGKSFNATCFIGIDASYNGTTTGGLTRFKWTVYANGTKNIEMTRL